MFPGHCSTIERKEMVTVYRVYVDDVVVDVFDSLEWAIREWDRSTYNLGRIVPGGIEVQEFEGEVMMRDGWILHIQPNGTVYLNPNLKG